MAGGDESFRERGYRYGKNLIEVQGRPLVEHVWETLRPLNADRVIFVIRKDDAVRFHLGDVLRLMAPGCTVLQTENPTRGAACTVLLAIDSIEPDEELVVANGDQILSKDLSSVVQNFRERELDAGTIVFDSVHPRWSFVRLDETEHVVEAAEKRPISRWATAGFYYFRRGGDFISSTMEMIRKDASVDGLFFVCPAFNEMILRHSRIGVHSIERRQYRSLSSPQNVEEYESHLTNLERHGERRG